MSSAPPTHFQPTASPWTACGFRAAHVLGTTRDLAAVDCKRCLATVPVRLTTSGGALPESGPPVSGQPNRS